MGWAGIDIDQFRSTIGRWSAMAGGGRQRLSHSSCISTRSKNIVLVGDSSPISTSNSNESSSPRRHRVESWPGLFSEFLWFLLTVLSKGSLSALAQRQRRFLAESAMPSGFRRTAASRHLAPRRPPPRFSRQPGSHATAEGPPN